MKTQEGIFPLSIEVSFKKLFDEYRTNLDSTNILLKQRAKQVLAIAEEFPVLSEGIKTDTELKEMAPQIDLILEDLFSSILGKNEIKTASFPFQNHFFKTSQRYDDIIANAGKGYSIELMDFNSDEFYIMGCSIVLGVYYGYNVDFKRPYYYKIPDANGILRSYRLIYNADFVSIEKTDKAIDISKEDVDRLLENYKNIEVWMELFPPNSWIFNGFVIANMFDVTVDTSISDFKTYLLSQIDTTDINDHDFENIFRSLFNLNSIKVGFSDYNAEEKTFENIYSHSYLLNGKQSQVSEEALCGHSYSVLFKNKEQFNITNVNKYHKKYPDNTLLIKLKEQNIQSALFATIMDKGKVLGILEIVSPNPNELNTINANKLKDIMPFLIDFVVRSKEKLTNDLELIIQNECTSIHSSVHWKFLKEAKQYYIESLGENTPVFKEIIFKNVYPLYGQVDIKGSSEARNNATKKDLSLQLSIVLKLIQEIDKIEPLLIYEQYQHRIESFLKELSQHLLVDSEHQVVKFLDEIIFPLFEHLRNKGNLYNELLEDYCSLDSTKSGFAYKNRKDYDDTVMMINKNMSSLLDHKQLEAQQMFPHYYERFKTDGVEHNLYVGDSITQNPDDFNIIYLYNLRLWQLQAMCEMENNFYSIKENLPIPLDVASMILVFNNPISLRFRMDEKRFDVDGTYNARYEVFKKRVDKSLIKGTEERVTQPGKISIIYSHVEDEIEYLRYISFLQSKKQLDIDLEIVEVEDLQGVTGLKALRVSLLYSNKDNTEKEYYTYEDLMKELD